MPTFKYKPYYSYTGPTHSQPFREQKSQEEAERSLELFYSELDHHFGGYEITTKREPGGVVSITVEMSEKDCDERVKNCLNDNDLYANKIKK